MDDLRKGIVIFGVLTQIKDFWLSENPSGLITLERPDGVICAFTLENEQVVFKKNSFKSLSPPQKALIEQSIQDNLKWLNTLLKSKDQPNSAGYTLVIQQQYEQLLKRKEEEITNWKAKVAELAQEISVGRSSSELIQKTTLITQLQNRIQELEKAQLESKSELDEKRTIRIKLTEAEQKAFNLMRETSDKNDLNKRLFEKNRELETEISTLRDQMIQIQQNVKVQVGEPSVRTIIQRTMDKTLIVKDMRLKRAIMGIAGLVLLMISRLLFTYPIEFGQVTRNYTVTKQNFADFLLINTILTTLIIVSMILISLYAFSIQHTGSGFTLLFGGVLTLGWFYFFQQLNSQFLTADWKWYHLINVDYALYLTLLKVTANFVVVFACVLIAFYLSSRKIQIKAGILVANVSGDLLENIMKILSPIVFALAVILVSRFLLTYKLEYPGQPDGAYFFIVSKADFFNFNSINVGLTIMLLSLFIIMTVSALVRNQWLRVVMGCIGIAVSFLWMFSLWLPHIALFTSIDPANPGQYLDGPNLPNTSKFYEFLILSAGYFAIVTLTIVIFYYSVYFTKKPEKLPDLVIPIDQSNSIQATSSSSKPLLANDVKK